MEAKLKDVYNHSRYSTNPEAFRGSMTFYIPSTDFEKHIRESAVWKLGNVGRKSAAGGGGGGGRSLLDRDGGGGGSGEEEEEREVVGVAVNGETDLEQETYDGPEKLLLRTKYLTDPGSRDTDELRAWASSAPEMKDVRIIIMYMSGYVQMYYVRSV